MKIMHEMVNFLPKTSLNVKWDDFPHFTYPWHFHSEYEIVNVLKSYGKRFVGDSIESFKDGDLVLIGNKLPHFWKSDEAFYKRKPDYRVNAIVVHFPSDFFKEEISNYSEFHHIKVLLMKSSRGIKFTAPTNAIAGEKLKELLDLSGLEQMLSFISFLNFLAQSKDVKLLASEAYRMDSHEYLSDRLDKVIHYFNCNYQQKIKLRDIAEKIGMNPTSFCRYFKEKTGKSFTSFVNEMRIGHACKLLVEGKLSISQICFECGFNNVSNYNRTFRKFTGFTPSEYQDQFVKANLLNTKSV